MRINELLRLLVKIGKKACGIEHGVLGEAPG
jgi:hypothetical protein